jgi:hypothetical protein
MNIGLAIVPSPDCWRERVLGTSTKIGQKVLIIVPTMELVVGVVCKYGFQAFITSVL